MIRRISQPFNCPHKVMISLKLLETPTIRCFVITHKITHYTTEKFIMNTVQRH